MDTPALTSDAIKELTSTLFVMNGLTKELEKERDIIVTSASQIASSTKQFQESIRNFKDLSPEVIRQFDTNINNAASAIAQHTADKTIRLLLEKTTDQIEEEITKVQRHSVEMNRHLSHFAEKIKHLSKMSVVFILGAALIGGILGGGLVHYLFPPLDPLMSLKLRYGDYMLNVWPKLDPKEQAKFLETLKAPTKRS